MSGNFQTLPGGGAGLDLSSVQPGQLLLLDPNLSTITGLDPMDAGPSLSNVGLGQLIKKDQTGLQGYDYSALGAKKQTSVAATNSDFTSIQSAIDNANEGDVVNVLPGLYNEALTLKKGIILYLHAGAIVAYSGNDNTPTLQFDSNISFNTNDPFVTTEGIGNFYNMYVLGEGKFLRYTADAYGNPQNTSVPTILIDSGSSLHVHIEAREIGLLKQFSGVASIISDRIKNLIVDDQHNSNPDAYSLGIGTRQIVQAEVINTAYCLNGAIQSIHCNQIVDSAYCQGGATQAPEQDYSNARKTTQWIVADSVAGGDGCWVDGGARAVLQVGYLSGCNVQGGTIHLNSSKCGSIRAVNTLYPAVIWAKSSYLGSIHCLVGSYIHAEASHIVNINVDSGGRAFVKANYVGCDPSFHAAMATYEIDSIGTGFSYCVSVENNDSEPQLQASLLELVGARISVITYYSNESTSPVRHKQGHLILRDCTILAHTDGDCTVRTGDTDLGTSEDPRTSLRLFGTVIGNKPLSLPTGFTPAFGSLTEDATLPY